MKIQGLIWRLIFFLFLTNNLLSQNNLQFENLVENEDYLANTLVYRLNPQSQQNNNLTVRYSQVQQPSTLGQLGVSHLETMFQENNKLSQRNNRTQITPSQNPLLYRITINPELDLSVALALLSQDPMVAYAEPLYIHHPMKKVLLTPNDPGLSVQDYITLSNFEAAWDITTGDASVKVGIVDAGFDLTHEDLIGRFSDEVDIGDNDTDLSGDSHGTEVVGCGFAGGNNGIGIAGAAYGCTFIPIKTSIGNGSSIVFGYEGVLKAAELGCKVINMSWGRTGEASNFEKDFLRYIVETYDVVLVASAGNDGNEGYFYPASYEEVISVGATNDSDAKAGLSNYNDKVDIIAQGENVVTTDDGDIYILASGTSFSAPLVSAVAALIYSQFPSLSAAQVRGRLLATTDIVQANTDFPSQLGTGRLNAFKALNETNLKFIEATNPRTTYASGERLNLIFDFQNLLDATSDLQVSLSSNSSYVTISDANTDLGALSTESKISNQSDPFVFQIDDTTPANSLIEFELTFTDGAFTQTAYIVLELSPQPDYLTLGINQTIFSSSQAGRVAAFDFLSPNAKGMNYKNYVILPELALMLGTSETALSHAVELGEGTPINPSFTTLSNIVYTNRSSDSFQETVTNFEDVTNNVNRVGVEVAQYAYAWRDAPNDKFVIVEFKVRNISGSDIAELPIALFADWDLLYVATNRADWQGSRNLGYAYSTESVGFYAGIRLLTSQEPLYYAMDKNGANGSIQVTDDFSATEKYTSISGGVARTQAGTSGDGNDIAQIIGGKLENLKFGETKSIAFALLVGEDFSDLETTADAALQQFQAFKTGTPPTFSNTQVCSGQDFLLKPDNGTLFKFYSKLPITEPLNLISTSNSLVLKDVTTNQTYYVTNVDSLYESEVTEVDISLQKVEADFTMSDTILELPTEGGLVNLEATGTDLVTYDWDFGNGETANTATTSAFFDTAQEYIVQLTATNTSGCTETIQKRLTVVGELPPITGLEVIENAVLNLYPNPATDVLQIETEENFSKLWIWDLAGQLIQEEDLNLSETNFTIDISSLPKGVYLLGFEKSNGTLELKKVVKH